MIKNVALTVTMATAVVLSGCQWQSQENRPDAAAREDNVLPPLHLGAVHQVYPEQGFVLLRIIGPMPKAGTVLITHPADGSNTRIGNLVVTSDQPAKNRIIAAEIRSGNLMKGDRVFMYRNIAQPVEQPAEEEPAEIHVPAVTPGEPIAVMPEEEPATVAPIEEETVQPEPEKPRKTTTPQKETPKHILDIPDNIDDWD